MVGHGIQVFISNSLGYVSSQKNNQQHWIACGKYIPPQIFLKIILRIKLLKTKSAPLPPKSQTLTEYNNKLND